VSIVDERRLARYERIYDQLRGLVGGTSPTLVAAMSTICAVLHAKMAHHLWTGFYFTAEPGRLYVGPYQGPAACQILRESGVCLHAVRTRTPVVVPDVATFPGHIACDPRAKSEIAIPLLKDGVAVAVFDADSASLHAFGEEDTPPLSRILSLLDPLL
jgi:L-methionine (R)-S-oxide reductase